MTISKYKISGYDSDDYKSLYQELIGTVTQLYGVDCFYIPRASNSPGGFDLLFGDDPSKIYQNSYKIELYIQSVDNFEGGNFFSKFGLEVKKQVRFLMPLPAFQREVPSTIATRPREGDLIYLHIFNALFEIKYADEEYYFYTFGKNNVYGYSLICEKFRYNDELVNTGIDEITNLVNTVKFVYNFNMTAIDLTGDDTYYTADEKAEYIGTYINEELVYQTANNSINGIQTATANVVNWTLPTGTLQLKDIKGLFIANQSVFGATSSANWILTSYNILQSVNHPLMINQDIETESDSILDFSEMNPQGNPSTGSED